MKHLKFYKEIDQWFGERWYVDLPDWTGSKADLEMVAGADTMLDMIGEGEREVHLNVSESYFEYSDELVFIEKADDIGNGAYYHLNKYRGIELNHRMWLCDVVLFIFTGFPEQIYFCKSKD